MLRIIQGIESTDAAGLAQALRQAISTADIGGTDAEELHSLAEALDSAQPCPAGLRCDHVCKADPGADELEPTDEEIVSAYHTTVAALRSHLPRGIVVEACFSVVMRHREPIVPSRCRNCDEITGPDGRCDCTRTGGR